MQKENSKFSRVSCISLLIIYLSFLLSLRSNAGEDIHGTHVTPQSGTYRQDGNVSPVDTFIADTITEEGTPPEKVIKLEKTFKPPDGLLFRKFTSAEKMFYGFARH